MNQPASPSESTSPDVSQQLTAIQQALSQIAGEVASLRQEIGQLQPLPNRLEQIERKLLAVGDLYRYEALHQALANQEWFAADKETVALIAAIAGVENIEDLTPQAIRSFPCGELQVIERLWSTYSNGHFGFSVQLQAYQDLGGSIETTIGEDRQLIERWGGALGWRGGVTPDKPRGDRWLPCDELDFSLNAPRGCHPSRWWNSPYGSRMTNYFLNRLFTCEI